MSQRSTRRLGNLAAALMLALVLRPAGAHAQSVTVVPDEYTFHRTATPGEELRVFGYAAFTHRCEPSPPPSVTLRAQPAHGTVSIRPGPSTVAVLRNGAGQCGGHTYDGTVVYYTPAPGYHGPDRFDYDVKSLVSTHHDTAEITVK